jgi:hypothetical protein
MKKVLLLVIVSVAIQAQSSASVSVDQTTSPAVLKNNGYSSQTADMVNISKARANNQEYYTADEQEFQNEGKMLKFWRKFYVYADPAAEDYSFYHHDTKTTPSYTDL